MIYTDHKKRQYFMFANVLNRQRAQWSISLLRCDFVITYRFGSKQIWNDVLFQQAYLAFKEKDAAYYQQKIVLIKICHFQPNAVRITTSMDASFVQDIRVSLKFDSLNLKLKNNASIFNLKYFQVQYIVQVGDGNFKSNYFRFIDFQIPSWWSNILIPRRVVILLDFTLFLWRFILTPSDSISTWFSNSLYIHDYVTRFDMLAII